VIRLNEFRKALLLGLIVGVIAELFGIGLLSIYLSNGVFTNFLGGAFFIALGISFLLKSVPAFIPIKQQKSISIICPYCESMVDKNAAICQKCKQQLD
jgi:hypothetical protein